MSLILGHYGDVLRAFAVLANAAPSNTDYNIHLNYIKDFKYEGYISALNDIFASVSDAGMAAMLLKNTGLDTIDLEGDGNTDNMAIATAFIAANAGNRVGAMLDLTKVLQSSGLAPATAFNANFDAAYAYATNSENTTFRAFDGSVEQVLTLGMDKLVGGAMNDYFKAYLVNGANTFQDGDVLDGGAGNDTLFADINAKQQGFAITAETKGIENVLFRVQVDQTDSGDNNIAGVGIIDAERMKDVLNWENNNSRADLVIEDVRINDDQITKDITITMRETDPGHVDYGVYFDQNSLRNTTENASQMNLRVLDTYAVAQGKNALLDSPYGAFTFYVSINGGTSTKVKLESQAMQDAQTLEEMVTAMQKAADAYFGANAVTVSLGSTYTVKDSVTGNDVSGNEIVVAAKSSAKILFSTTEAGSGWRATDTVPAVSGLYTSFTTGATVSTDLVTSTIVLDYVGRGSNGGDLVVGGLSVGDTSSSKGVQRFEITVEDDSRLQTINSTNNTLREVTIKNGEQTRINDAYNKVDEKGGLLSVIGADHALGNGTVDPAASNAALPGTAGQHNAYGFSDVRLIDGSAMTGKLTFDAEITSASKAKYLNLTDTGANPSTDNVSFVYSGGSNDDTMLVDIDSAVASSVNTLTAREDFSFTLNGGAGNDAITVGIKDNTATNWYDNQAQLNNVTINGGDGNDTIKTTSSGDFVINAGSGNDTVYIGNNGDKSVWVVSTQTDISGAGTTAAAVGTDLLGVAANATPVFMAGGKLTVIWSGAGATTQPIAGGVMGDSITGSISAVGAKSYTNGLEVTVDIPTGENYAVTQYHINQAIKDAINNDPVLNKLLKAYDGPTTSLVIESLVDGANVASDLKITAWNSNTYTATDTQVLSAYHNFTHNSTADIAAVNAAITANITAINLRDGMVNDVTPATQFHAGSNSAFTTDNIIDLGAGQDVLVLSTSAAANEVVKFTAASGVDATVVNFSTGAIDNTDGGDQLDFTAYLTSKISSSGSTASQARVATSLNTDATLEVNSVTILDSVVFTVAKTFDGLTADNFKAAINSTNTAGAADYATIGEATLGALNTYAASGPGVLVNNLGKAVVMVENDANKGEYKVFEMTFKGQTGTNATGDFDTVTLIGTVDFGASLDGTTTPVFALANLV